MSDITLVYVSPSTFRAILRLEAECSAVYGTFNEARWNSGLEGLLDRKLEVGPEYRLMVDWGADLRWVRPPTTRKLR